MDIVKDQVGENQLYTDTYKLVVPCTKSSKGKTNEGLPYGIFLEFAPNRITRWVKG